MMRQQQGRTEKSHFVTVMLTEEARSSELNILASPKSPETTMYFRKLLPNSKNNKLNRLHLTKANVLIFRQKYI